MGPRWRCCGKLGRGPLGWRRFTGIITDVGHVRALERRAGADTAPSTASTSFGELRLDPEAHRIWVKDEEKVLTALEFKLLETLLAGRGRVQTRERLLMVVWNMPADLSTRTVDTHVKRLRQKLGSAGRYIETVRGIGYRFTDDPGREDA